MSLWIRTHVRWLANTRRSLLNLSIPARTHTQVDLSRLDDDWNAKKGKFAATSEAIQARALWVRKFLRDRPESCIVLVSHNDFLEGVYPQENTPGGWSRMNLGTRQYIFCAADGEEDEEAKLKEVCSVTKEGQLSNERPI